MKQDSTITHKPDLYQSVATNAGADIPVEMTQSLIVNDFTKQLPTPKLVPSLETSVIQTNIQEHVAEDKHQVLTEKIAIDITDLDFPILQNIPNTIVVSICSLKCIHYVITTKL
jgi:hypothetical protein